VAWAPAGWKTAVSHVAAFAIALIFIASGVWKITDPFGFAGRLPQFHVPQNLSLLTTFVVGVGEAFSGVLILIPRFRRWGAWLAGAMLVGFMVYIGALYGELRGADCSCFPLVERVVGPAFFIGDGIMLALAALAGLWARPSHCLRSAAIVLLAVVVFAGVSLGVNARVEASVKAPATIHADGQTVSLRRGRAFLFFYDPKCLHCADAARAMAGFHWKPDVKLITVPTEDKQFAQQFLRDAGLRAATSEDAEALREAFHFVMTPYAVALDRGRVKASFAEFEQPGYENALRKAGYTE
jgi:uncharacterized membrane protein YphA (DoxX/SURF4 family)